MEALIDTYDTNVGWYSRPAEEKLILINGT